MPQRPYAPLPGENDSQEALPEPRRVKREALQWRQEAHAAAEEFTKYKDARRHKRWAGAVLRWYMNITAFVDDMAMRRSEYEDLQQIEDNLKDGKKLPDAEQLWKYTKLLERFMKDMGVTNIGLERPSGEWGYDYLQGLPFSEEVEREDAGFRRSMANVRNMKQTLRIDTDFCGIVWGPNRVGKDTLAQQIVMPDADPQREQYVMNDDDFWTAVDQPQYFSFYIPEMSDHFYTQDTAKRSNKKKKRKMKKYAKKNMFMVGCDLNFWKIDQEFVDDKVSFAIHIPRRGYFEFYTAAQIERFERGDERTEVVTPDPAFTGRFPKLTRKDPRWDLYKKIEDEKLKVEREETEEDKVNTEQIIKKIKDRIDHYKKPYGDRYILQEGVVKREFEELKGNDEEWKIVKDSVENDMGWRTE